MLYLISSILLFLLLVFMPKTKEKINFIKTIITLLLCVFAYHTFVCYLLTFVEIPITLTNLAIVNFVISLLILLFTIKKKGIQTYFIAKKDLFITGIIALVTVIMVGVNFQFFTKIRYISMDAMQHYKAAREFSENTALFHKVTENSTTATSHMPMGYVNVGILFKMIKPWIGVIPLYHVYILWETLIYFLVGLVFYFCVKEHLKTKNKWWVGILFLFFYFIGYPLNSLISGFHYLLIGILYFMAIFEFFLHSMPRKEIKEIDKVLIVALFNLGLIFSYSLFCPVIYLAEFLYLIKQYQITKNKKQFLLFLLISLILTGLMGSHISILERTKDSGSLGLQLEGWIYKNSWSNIILLLPFSIYYVVSIIKEKSKFWEKTIYFFFILFLTILGIGTKLKFCSNYYFYKNYYILWFLLFYTSLRGMLKLIEQNNWKKYLVNGFVCYYIFFFILSCFFINTYVQTGEKQQESFIQTMEIYTFNKTNMLMNVSFVSKGELELLNQLDIILEHDWKDRKDLLLVGTDTHEKWVQALTGYYNTIFPNAIQKIDDWNNGKYQYLLAFKKGIPQELFDEKIKTEDAKIIYQNDSGMLVKYILEETEK